jgi:hypothetical protein
MKKLNKLMLLFLLMVTVYNLAAQEKPAEKELKISSHYFSKNNGQNYLLIKARWKQGKKSVPAENTNLDIFINDSTSDNRLATVKTNNRGESIAFITAAYKNTWDTIPQVNFIVRVTSPKTEEPVSAFSITKARMNLDTINEDGTRKVRLFMEERNNNEWVPVKEAEIKIGIKRLGSYLKINEEESYTTDSVGEVIADFAINNLPAGDEKGNIILVARTEDNENYGNVMAEKIVPWGTFKKTPSHFNERSLWATRDKAPVWLLLMAFSIMASVWMVILYLIFKIFQISRLGKREERFKVFHKIRDEEFV